MTALPLPIPFPSAPGLAPLAVAHKGGNTLAILRASETLGVHLVEADIWLHRGRLELRHSAALGRLPLLFEGVRPEPGWRPRLTLDALLAAAAPETAFMFDLKGHDLRLSYALIEAMRRLAPGRLYSVCGQVWDLLDPFLEEPMARVVHSVGSTRMLAEVRARVRDVATPALSVDFRVLTRERVETLREFAPLVIAWIVNSALDAERAIEWGVNGITSDNFALLGDLIARIPVLGAAESGTFAEIPASAS